MSLLAQKANIEPVFGCFEPDHRADARGIEHKPVYCYTSGLGRFRLDWL
jgi:hypothetical protein